MTVARSSLFILLTLWLLGPGCRADKQETSVSLTELKMGAATVKVEVARTEEESRIGLMNRDHLPADQGMLFIRPSPGQASFWMKNTRIPLSIAYLNSEGTIVEIYSLTPGDLRPVTSISHDIAYALEVNAGWFQKKGVTIGDRVVPVNTTWQELALKHPDKKPAP